MKLSNRIIFLVAASIGALGLVIRSSNKAQKKRQKRAKQRDKYERTGKLPKSGIFG